MNRDELLHKLGNNHNALACEIRKGVIQASIPVLQKLCELPISELEQVYLAATGCGEYCRIYCIHNYSRCIYLDYIQQLFSGTFL